MGRKWLRIGEDGKGRKGAEREKGQENGSRECSTWIFVQGPEFL